MSNRWQDGVNLLLGLWLFVSPWSLEYSGQEAAAWNAHVMGATIIICAWLAVFMPKIWEELLNMVFGAWLVISPYALGFASDTTVAVHTVAVGVLTVGFATWATLSNVEVDKWWREHHFL